MKRKIGIVICVVLVVITAVTLLLTVLWNTVIGSQGDQVSVSKPAITGETEEGTGGAILDYADEKLLIFHGEFGLFVYSIEDRKMIHEVDLKAIGCDATQGDWFCEVSVLPKGETVYLHVVQAEEMYVFDVAGGQLSRQKYDMTGVETAPKPEEGQMYSSNGLLESMVYVPMGEPQKRIRLFGSIGDELRYENTVFYYNDTAYDIQKRNEAVNAITDCTVAGDYVIVEGHISPQNSYYGIFNTKSGEFEKDILGSHLTWCKVDKTVKKMKFDVNTIIYAVGNEIYGYDGTLLATCELSEKEQIYDVWRDDQTIGVQIMDGENPDNSYTAEFPVRNIETK